MADYLEVPTPDGRILDVLITGAPDGYPLLYHCGTPYAAAPFRTLDEAAARAGLRVIGYSRPGYAESTPWPYFERGPRIADDVVDSATLLHHLGVDEFVTLGWSGGGPRAIACAALLPGRCRAATTLGSVAPYDAEDLDWTAGMADGNVEGFGAAADGATTYHQYLRRQPDVDRSPEHLVEVFGDAIPPVDAAYLPGDLAVHMSEARRRAGAQGVVGARDDGLSLVGPWGFDVATVQTPVAVWHGRPDRLVPFAHGEWLVAHLPGAHARLLDNDGHFSLWSHVDEALGDLKDLAGL